jgi:hypothetical protein
MRKFLLVLKGKGEGCDYTIGCNTLVDEVEGYTPHEAFVKWYKDWKGIEDFDEININTDEFSSVTLYEIVDTSEINLEQFYKQIIPEEKHDPEFSEYLRLKEKYESNTQNSNDYNLTNISTLPTTLSKTQIFPLSMPSKYSNKGGIE